MAEFLNHLFTDLKYKTGTISGYRTALCDFLRVHSNEDFSESAILSRLLFSFKSEEPKPVDRCPKWDLSLVLNYLASEKFEPIDKIEMKLLTWKTVFLVALATASRGSELHALSFRETWFDNKWRGIQLGFIPGFKAKTQKHNDRIEIPALSVDDGSSEERRLCPVRALKAYRNRTRQYRAENPKVERLFVSFKTGHSHDICKNTIAGWIRALIHATYAHCPESVIKLTAAKPHEVRALATSLAWRNNIPLAEVLEAANWTNQNTFISRYLRDTALTRDGLSKLGPVVAAQTIVRPH